MLLLARHRFLPRAGCALLLALCGLTALAVWRLRPASYRNTGSSCGRVPLSPPRSLLQTYRIYSRSADEEARLQREPRPEPRELPAYSAPAPICSDSALVLLVVHSAARNFENRARIRRVFRAAAPQFAPPIFVIATRSVDKTVVSALDAESTHFGDLLRLPDVEDHYHNIAHKPRAWIDFLARLVSQEPRCQGAKFVLKLDDDVLVDVGKLSTLLARFAGQRHVVLCRVFPNGQITRNPASKWYLSKLEYRVQSLGLYCQGMAYVFSVGLLPKMRGNLERVQYLWMDDWYVTHALMNGTRAVFFDVAPHIISTNDATQLRDELARRRRDAQPIFAHFRPDDAYSPAEKERIWAKLRQSHRKCD